MKPWSKLHLLIFHDILCFALVMAWFFLPGGDLLALLGLFLLTKRFNKAIQARSAPLQPNERKIYFLFMLTAFLIAIGLLLTWLIRHSSAATWSFGSLGLIILLTMLYQAYDTIYGSDSRI